MNVMINRKTNLPSIYHNPPFLLYKFANTTYCSLIINIILYSEKNEHIYPMPNWLIVFHNDLS